MRVTIVFVIFCFGRAGFADPYQAEKSKAKFALYKSYMAAIKNSIGGRSYRNLYYRLPGGSFMDVLQKGNLSCAYFVSSILTRFGLIKDFQINVEETVKVMKESGWKQIEKPRPGSVIVWSKVCFKKSGECHMHISFFIDKRRAISNASNLRYPAIHGLHPNGRKIVEILWHPALE